MYYTQEELQDLHFNFEEKFEREIENRMPASYVSTKDTLSEILRNGKLTAYLGKLLYRQWWNSTARL